MVTTNHHALPIAVLKFLHPEGIIETVPFETAEATIEAINYALDNGMTSETIVPYIRIGERALWDTIFAAFKARDPVVYDIYCLDAENIDTIMGDTTIVVGSTQPMPGQ